VGTGCAGRALAASSQMPLGVVQFAASYLLDAYTILKFGILVLLEALYYAAD
jgi:hypothetical protein